MVVVVAPTTHGHVHPRVVLQDIHLVNKLTLVKPNVKLLYQDWWSTSK